MKTETQKYQIEIECPKGTGDLKMDITKELETFMDEEVKATKFLVIRR